MTNIEQLKQRINYFQDQKNWNIDEIDKLKSEIIEIIKIDKEKGKIFGPLIQELSKIKKSIYSSNKKIFVQPIYKPSDKISNWVQIGNGFLKIGHKPGGKNRSYETLVNEKTTTVLTILSEKEGAKNIFENVQKLGIDWLWIPLSNGNIPPKNMEADIIRIFGIIMQKLNNQERIYIHCAAGLHRTGMITNALLIFMAYDENKSLEIIYKLRPITAYELREHRLNWGKQFKH